MSNHEIVSDNKTKVNKVTIIFALLAFLLPMIVYAWNTTLWATDFSVDIGLGGGDMSSFLFFLKSIQDFGLKGAYFNEMVGAPEIATVIDIPFVDFFSTIEIYIITLFTQNYILTYYLYKLLSYGLSAAAMFYALKEMKLRNSTALFISFLFAMCPYAFLNGISIINIYPIPLGILLAMYSCGFVECNNKWKLIITVILAATGPSYYTVFVGLLCCFALIYRLIDTGSLKKSMKSIGILLGICGCLAVFTMPKTIYSLINGKNTVVSVRSPIEGEYLGLKLIQMLLPVWYSRLPFAQKITEKYTYHFPIGGGHYMTTPIGILATVGFVFFLFILIRDVIKHDANDVEKRKSVFLGLSLLGVLLVVTAGGLGLFVNFYISPQLRAWCRASVLISGICYFGLAYLLEAFTNKMMTKPKLKILSYVVCACMVGIQFLDSIPTRSYPDLTAAKISQESYQSFFNEVRSCLNEKDMVYQLPYQGYCEYGYINAMPDYAHFKAYRLCDDIRWSYGAVMGRDLRYGELNVDNGMSTNFVSGIQAEGFRGVYIDTLGYADGGTEIIGFYESLGYKEIISENGQLYFFLIG